MIDPRHFGFRLMSIYRVVFWVLFLVLTSFHFKEDVAAYQIILDPESNISVRGKSNVNRFHCEYSGVLSDTLLIKINDQRDDKILTQSSIKIQVDLFDCGIKQMTNDMMGLLNEDEYPHLEIQVSQIERAGSVVCAKTQITIAGCQSEYELFTEVGQKGTWSICKGSLDINIRNFGLEPPKKLFGAIQVEEIITIDFDLMLQIIEVSP